jgi:hypothetical protein
VADAEARARKLAEEITETRELSPTREEAMCFATWVLGRLSREALRRVMPFDFPRVAHLKGMNEAFSPAAVFTRLLQWAPGGVTQALFLKRRSRNRYSVDAYQRSPQQMAELRRTLAERAAMLGGIEDEETV